MFNSTFQRLSNGAHLKTYQPLMESAFMTAFHTAMLGGVAIAAIGIAVAYLRGPEPKELRRMYIKTCNKNLIFRWPFAPVTEKAGCDF